MSELVLKEEKRNFELTEEQKNIINTLESDDKVIKINASAGSGKAQPLYSKILTNNGWVKMGDIKIGDKVASSNGGFSNVTGIFPRGKMDIYRVYFDNGDYTDCTADHLWTTQTDFERNNNIKGQVRTTQQIIDTLYYSNKTGTRVVKNHSVPFVKPIEFKDEKLPLSPYILGVLIGDGGLTDSIINITNPEKDIIDRVLSELPDTDKITTKYPKNRCVYHSIQNKTKWKRSFVSDLIKHYNLNVTSYFKHIPKDYLYSSIKNRIALLQGLMDTDGTVDYNKKKSSYVSFSTSSYQLALDVKELCESLGANVRISERMGKYKKNNIIKETRKNYNLSIYFYGDKTIQPFYCKKKSNVYMPPKRNYKRYISKIEKIGNDEVQCIKVSADDELYVTDNYILTHNTSTLVELVKKIREKDTDSKILYVVFNRSMLEEAKKKFANYNVECQTTHGFALKRFSAIKDGEIEVIPSLDFNVFMELKNKPKYKKSWIRFKAINDLLNSYCLSYDDLETFKDNIYKKNSYGITEKISYTERDFFIDMYNYLVKNNLYTHGMYLKEYACFGKDTIKGYKYLLLDEAQDLNALFYCILKRIKCDKIYAVGDEKQNIYSFLKTINVFKKLDGEYYPLSTSFRINNKTCELANRILKTHYTELNDNYINNKFNNTELENKKEKTILFRLNSTLFEYAVNLISKTDNIKVNFMDVVNGNNADKFEDCFNDMLYFYYRLIDSQDKEKAQLFKSEFHFSNCKTVDNYIKICKKEGMGLYHYLYRNKSILPLDFAKYFNFFLLNELDIIEVLNKVKLSEECENPNKTYTLITAHRAKGLEWGCVVKISPDQWSLKTDSECNLCYVAVTRAKNKLDAKPIEELLEIEER